ncbi:MAG: Methyl-accepting chemotaxis protein, partial [Hydrocarboniphaga sp.]|uniref:PAS domain S-box protein n=1 Tax=Hydrocarboniphaga sp. TaxID=2033016 RepID=UPI0026129498
MKSIQDLPIARKLLLAFSIACVLTAGLGVYSLLRLDTAHEYANRLESDSLPRTQTLTAMKSLLLQTRIDELQLIQQTDADERADYMKRLQNDRAEYQAAVKRYDALASKAGGELAKRIEAVRQASEQYFKVGDQIVAAASARKTGQLAELADSSREWRRATGKAIDGVIELEASNSAVESASFSRHFSISVRMVAAATVVLSALSLMIGWWVARSIKGPLARAVAVAEGIAAGRLDNPIGAIGGDEVGTLLAMLERMQQQLLERARGDRRKASELARVKQGLDVVATNVMVADAEFNIVYLNESIKAMLQQAEADIRKDVPAFNAESVVGASIDLFNKNPAFQRELLAKLNATHEARLVLGSLSFSLIVNLIQDDRQERIGYVFEWRDITAELLQRERDAESQGRIAAISASQAVIELGMDGIVLAANDKFEDAMGYSLSEIKGRHHGLLCDPNYRQSIEYQQFWEKLNRGESESGQYKRIGKDGREVWLQALYNPINDASGKPFKVVEYATDVSAQVMAARVLEQAVEQTQDVVAAARRGDLDQRIPLDGKTGAVRDLCEGVNSLVENMSAVVVDVGRVFGALAEGDLTQTIETEYQGAFQKIKQ